MKKYLKEMLYALTSAYTQTDYTNRERTEVLETNIGKLFSIFAWGLDSVQEQAELIREWDNLDNAKGAVLDRYGANFGVRRFGAGDVFYRLAIKVKLLAQLSGGDSQTVIDAAASLFDIPPERVGLREMFPAKVQLDLEEMDLSPETLAIAAEIAELIKRILAAGVGLIIMLHNSREWRSDVIVPTAVFDHSHLTFTMPQVQRRFTSDVPVAPAAFMRSGVFVNIQPVRYLASQDVAVKAAMFEHTRVAVNSIYREENEL